MHYRVCVSIVTYHLTQVCSKELDVKAGEEKVVEAFQMQELSELQELSHLLIHVMLWNRCA